MADTTTPSPHISHLHPKRSKLAKGMPYVLYFLTTVVLTVDFMISLILPYDLDVFGGSILGLARASSLSHFKLYWGLFAAGCATYYVLRRFLIKTEGFVHSLFVFLLNPFILYVIIVFYVKASFYRLLPRSISLIWLYIIFMLLYSVLLVSKAPPQKAHQLKKRLPYVLYFLITAVLTIKVILHFMNPLRGFSDISGGILSGLADDLAIILLFASWVFFIAGCATYYVLRRFLIKTEGFVHSLFVFLLNPYTPFFFYAFGFDWLYLIAFIFFIVMFYIIVRLYTPKS